MFTQTGNIIETRDPKHLGAMPNYLPVSYYLKKGNTWYQCCFCLGEEGDSALEEMCGELFGFFIMD